MHLNSELLFKKHGLSYFKDNIRVLEIGPAGIPSPYEKIVNNKTITWHTLDIYSSYPGITYVAQEEYNYPVDSESYDLIISGQVIEHVKKIWLWMSELRRILKKDGTLIIVNPVSWPFHEFPVDCWRIFPDGMKALCEDAKLNLIFSQFESVEAEHFANTRTPTIPGQSYTFPDQRKRMIFINAWNRVIHYVPLVKKLKIPIEVAYDTITVAKK